MKKHIATVCKGAELEKVEGVVVVNAADTMNPNTKRVKPGPKPVDLTAYLHGRLAAFTTSSDDERIDYIFSSGLIETLFTTRIEDIPSLFFEHLWSDKALEQFQSLVMHKNSIHEIVASDVDTGAITYEVRGTLTKRFLKEFAIYALELAYAVAKDSVPSRLPERIPEARYLFDRLTNIIDGMTLRDAIKHSGSYTKHSFATRHKLDETLSKLSLSMTSHFANCFM
jgi:hypothetical protein